MEQWHPPSCHFSLLFCRNSEPYIFSFVLPLLAGGMTVSIGLRRNERVSHSVPAASARVPSVSPRGEGRLGQALVRGPTGFSSCGRGFRMLLGKARLKSGVTVLSRETRECVSFSCCLSHPAHPPLLLLLAQHPHRVQLRANCQSSLSELIGT